MMKKRFLHKSNQVQTSENQTKKLSVSNAVQLDPSNPIPIEYNGEAFAPFSGGGYTPFIGNDDRFANTLLEARLLSLTCNACVTTKKDYAIGEGLTLIDSNQKTDAEFEKFLKSCNNKNESLNTISEKAFDNFFTFGNCYLEIVRGSAGGKKFIKAYLRSQLECRLDVADEDDRHHEVIISKRFKNNGIISIGDDDRRIKLFNPLFPSESWTKDVKNKSIERTVIHIKNEVAGYESYGMPSNIASLPQQVQEYEMVRYNLDDLDNNMNPGGMLILKGNVSPEESTKIAKKIIQQHTGKGKRGRWVVISSEEGIDDGSVHQFNTQKEGSFLEMDRRVEEKIIFANGWDALLAGLSSGSSLGKGNNYILNLFKIKYKTVIEPVQRKVFQEMIAPLFTICDAWMGTKWSDYQLQFLTNTPLSIIETDDTMNAWTINEVREEAGLPPLNDNRGDMLFSDFKNKKQEDADKQP